MRTIILCAVFALFVSCRFFDDTSTMGSDVTGAADSSATTYDGNYHTNYLSTANAAVLADTLAGRHRYRNYLNGSGELPFEAALGIWKNQRSRVSMTFAPDSSNDSTGINEVLDSLYSNLATAPDTASDTHKRLRARLTFATAPSKSTAKSYNIRALAMPHKADSQAVWDALSADTLQELGVGTAGGDYSSASIPLNVSRLHDGAALEDTTYRLTRISALDTVRITYTDTIVDTLFTATDSTVSDTLPSVTKIADTISIFDTAHTREDSILPLKSVPVYDFRPFSFDELAIIPDSASDTLIDTFTIAAGDLPKGYTAGQGYRIIARRDSAYGEDNNLKYDTIADTLDTLIHYSDSTAQRDSLSLPRQFYADTDTAVTDTLSSDSTATVVVSRYLQERTTDTVTYVSQTISQTAESPKSRLVLTDSEGNTVTYNDSLSIGLDITSVQDTALLFMADPRIVFSIEEYPDTTGDAEADTITHSISYRPCFYRMNVETADTETAQAVYTDGGAEKVARINLGMTKFWEDIKNRGSNSIVYTKLGLISDSAVFPEYHGDRIKVNGVILDTLYDDTATSVGALLARSDRESFAFTVESNADTIYLEDRRITDNLLDILYSPKNKGLAQTPETYLYLWIDGDDFGRVYWNDNAKSPFTYIIQD
ncbi:MAG: hypothetical protein ACQEQV_08035 [Fibrobacterota bacterium]